MQRSLFLPADNDLLLRPELSREAHRLLSESDKPSSLATLEGAMGHLNGVVGIAQAEERLRAFLTD